MAQMTVRSSYALDEETAENIKRLAKGWGVSQAEVIRRSIRRVTEQEGRATMTPAEVVAAYASGTEVRSAKSVEAINKSLRNSRRAEERRRTTRG